MTDNPTGQQGATNGNGEFNAISFMIRQFMGTVRGSALVQVVACTNTGDVSPIGTVDVTPLVNQIDGAGNSVPHGTIAKLPYMRIQGGANAVINDPQPGDIGIAVFCDRDISAVKSTKARANPGSFRRNDWADGVYVMTVIGAAPTQYLRFFADGIEILDKSSNHVLMNSDGITLNGVKIDRSGNISGVGTLMASGEGTFNGSHTVSAHRHGGVQTGGGTTGTPTG